jgi:hypothetical protein
MQSRNKKTGKSRQPLLQSGHLTFQSNLLKIKSPLVSHWREDFTFIIRIAREETSLSGLCTLPIQGKSKVGECSGNHTPK